MIMRCDVLCIVSWCCCGNDCIYLLVVVIDVLYELWAYDEPGRGDA